ncbi:hypothetical protein AB1E18_005210 [Capra hircus]
MELNSLLILLEAAEYLERRDREAEHGYASVLPFDGDFARKKTKAAGLVRKAPNNRSSHNELEKHRRAKLRLYLEQLKQLVPLGPDSTRHTTLSLLKRAKMHIKKLEEQDRRALSIKEQLQREHRFLKRRLEQLSAQSLERVRTDSTGSAVSTDDSEQEVDVEGMEFGPGELDSVGSSSDVDDHYSLRGGGCSHGSFGPPCRRPGRPGLSLSTGPLLCHSGSSAAARAARLPAPEAWTEGSVKGGTRPLSRPCLLRGGSDPASQGLVRLSPSSKCALCPVSGPTPTATTSISRVAHGTPPAFVTRDFVHAHSGRQRGPRARGGPDAPATRRAGDRAEPALLRAPDPTRLRRNTGSPEEAD